MPRARLHAAGVAATEYITDFEQGMTRFDGKQCTKIEMLNFVVAHEMYHRGQLTVYERLLGNRAGAYTVLPKDERKLLIDAACVSERISFRCRKARKRLPEPLRSSSPA